MGPRSSRWPAAGSRRSSTGIRPAVAAGGCVRVTRRSCSTRPRAIARGRGAGPRRRPPPGPAACGSAAMLRGYERVYRDAIRRWDGRDRLLRAPPGPRSSAANALRSPLISTTRSRCSARCRRRTAWTAVGRPADGQPGNGSVDPTANGTLHWVPRHDEGLRQPDGADRRLDQRDRPRPDGGGRLRRGRPLMCRLMGVPTVVVAMRGDRLDRAHRAAYDAAARAAGRRGRPSSPCTDWPIAWQQKTFHAGAISRFADRRADCRLETAADTAGCWCCGGPAAAGRPERRHRGSGSRRAGLGVAGRRMPRPMSRRCGTS